jgi:hypothetical protein
VRACVVAGIGFFTDSYDVSQFLWPSANASKLLF